MADFIPEISASHVGNNKWLFTRTTEPRRLVGGTHCEIICEREYDAYDVVLVVDWLAERAAGYPKLKRFEGGANWPGSVE